jgi:alkaline phosphatase
VFQGHQHSGGYSQIEGIHYYTLKAVVEGPGEEDNAYAVVEVRPDGRIIVTGYRKAVSRRMAASTVRPAFS